MLGRDREVSGRNSGLLWVNSKITSPELSPTDYTRWYEKVHIPDVLRTSGIEEAYRYKAVNPEDDRPYLALYPLKDLDFLQTDEFRSIPVHDDHLPGSHAIFDLADFDTRYYRHVQLYEPDSRSETQPDFVISCGFTPADDDEYDRWYREEHLKEVSAITGWRRTERYVLTFARQNRKVSNEKEIPEPPKFLTLHYFDGTSLPEKELTDAGKSERTKKNMGSMQQTQIAVFKKLSQFSMKAPL